MVALYVASHYKNSPNDLQLMSDAPAHHLFVLLGLFLIHYFCLYFKVSRFTIWFMVLCFFPQALLMNQQQCFQISSASFRSELSKFLFIIRLTFALLLCSVWNINIMSSDYVFITSLSQIPYNWTISRLIFGHFSVFDIMISRKRACMRDRCN